MPRLLRCTLAAVALLWVTLAVSAAEPLGHPKDPRVIDAQLPALAEFRTADTAIASRISRALAPASSQPGYLGIDVDLVSTGRVVVAEVEPDSPAARAGLQPGDVVRAVAGQEVTTPAGLRDLMLAKAPGETVPLALLRRNLPLELSVTLAATSRPLSLTTQRAILGLQVLEVTEGLRVERLTPGMPAAEAGLKSGDVLLSVDGRPLSGQERLSTLLSERKPGETVTVVYKRDGKTSEVKAKLVADPSAFGDPRQLQWDTRGLTPWKKDVYHLAVLRIEYPDVKHNPQITAWDWEQALFSRRVYNNKSATGQQVYGSMNDYYLEQSCSTFHVEGKAFDPVLVGRKRADYANDGNRFALLTEALDRLLERDGKDALKDFDGIFFMYAGDRFQTNRGGLYWPHRSMLRHKGKGWNYFICPEGASRMDTISVLTHEFGHMLGLPDLYARPETPGSEGLGIWCTMAVGHGLNGRPLHFSAWCKEQLGWLKPTVLDPTVKQKLILAPVENSPKECFKVMLRPDGSEYLLLENRAARSFDRDLPGEGLLIWRVVDGKPVLEESHGIEGPLGPDRFLTSVPFPSKSNNAFTPYTTPSSKSLKGGGLPVWITNIRRLPDGRVTFYLGYEYL